MNKSLKKLAESIVDSLNDNEFDGIYEADGDELFVATDGTEYHDAVISWEAEQIGNKMVISVEEATGFLTPDSIDEKDFTFNLKELNNLVNDML